MSDLIWVPGEEKFEPEPQLQSAGGIVLDGQHVADTLQCVHCKMHWIPIKGSRVKRGFCMKCLGTLCGKGECFNYDHEQNKKNN